MKNKTEQYQIRSFGNDDWEDCNKETYDRFNDLPQQRRIKASPSLTEQPKGDFYGVLETNYQAQIAGYYNDDKTDQEREIRQAVITEYEDLLAIFRSRKWITPLPLATPPSVGELYSKEDMDFIESALNHYWNDAHTNLQRKDLGDLERIMYQKQKEKAKLLIDKIEQNPQPLYSKEAVEFAEWILKDGAEQCFDMNNYWWEIKSKPDQQLTTEEIYKLYNERV